MAARLPDDVRAAIAADLRATAGTPEGARVKIAEKHGVAGSTVGLIANEIGVTFARTRTQKATEAKTADMAARRAALAVDLLAFAEESLQYAREARRGKVTVDKDTPGYAIDLLPTAAQAMVGAGIALDKHRMLDQYDNDARGAAAVDAWLRHLTGETTPDAE